NSAGQREVEILSKFRDGCFMLLRSQLFIEKSAAFRIKKLNAGFSKKARGFLQAGPKHLRERIARLIFQWQFFLPPAHQLPAMFLDQLVGRIRMRIEAKAFVQIRSPRVIPSLPLSRVVWERKRKTDVGLGHAN